MIDRPTSLFYPVTKRSPQTNKQTNKQKAEHKNIHVKIKTKTESKPLLQYGSKNHQQRK